MADKGRDPIPVFKKSLALTKNYKNTEILCLKHIFTFFVKSMLFDVIINHLL